MAGAKNHTLRSGVAARRAASGLPIFCAAALVLAAFFPPGVVGAASTDKAEVAKPARVVSLVPAITETLFALGLGDRVVGVSAYCDFPPEARSLPKVGTFSE